MNNIQTEKEKWANCPTDKFDADIALIGRHCIACGSTMLLAIIQPPVNVWRVHCNHCAAEIPIVVLLNRGAWKRDAPVHGKKRRPLRGVEPQEHPRR
jgi:hypothetical protein